MNILNDKSDFTTAPKNETELVELEKQEYHLLGTFLRTAGLRIFGYNHITNMVFEVKIKRSNTVMLMPIDNTLVPTDYEAQKVEVDARFEYFEALNFKSAEKRVYKYRSGLIPVLCNLRKPGNGIKFF